MATEPKPKREQIKQAKRALGDAEKTYRRLIKEARSAAPSGTMIAPWEG